MKKGTSSAMKVLSPKGARKSTEEDAFGSPMEGKRSALRIPRPGRKHKHAIKDLPDAEADDEILKTWGMTVAQEDERLSEFRKQIEAVVGPLKPVFDKYYLRRFLRARQHDLVRAKEMFLAHHKWRQEYGIDTILEDFHFEERDAFLTLYPQGYHKTDKLGRPIYIQHLGSINLKALKEITTEERMIRYHVQEYERALKYIFPACSKVAGKHMGQTLAIMDVKGVGLRHLTGEVKRVLGSITRIDQDNYPETLGKTLIINAPGLFKAVWAVVKPMLDVRTQNKIEVCPSDYMKSLLHWVDIENIPEYLGGKSKGSLIDDVGPWQDPAIIAEIDLDIVRRNSSMPYTTLGSPAGTISEGGALGISVCLPATTTTVSAGGETSTSLGFTPTGPGPKPSPFDVYSSASQAVEVSSVGAAAAGGPTVTRLPSGSGGMNGGSNFASAESAFGTAHGEESGEESSEVFYDALTRRLSISSVESSMYASADEGESICFEPPSPATPASIPSPFHPDHTTAGTADFSSDTSKMDLRLSSMQIPILARIRALEERLPEVERGVQRYLPPHVLPPSVSIGQGTLLSRVTALEKGMDTLLQAQMVALDRREDGRKSNRCCCCSIM